MLMLHGLQWRFVTWWTLRPFDALYMERQLKKMTFSNLIFPYQSLIKYHITSHHIIYHTIYHIRSHQIRSGHRWYSYSVFCLLTHWIPNTIVSFVSAYDYITSFGITYKAIPCWFTVGFFFFFWGGGVHIKFVGLSVYSFLALWSSITARISYHPYNSKWITRVLSSMSYNHMISAIFQLHIFGIIDIWSKLFIHFI